MSRTSRALLFPLVSLGLLSACGDAAGGGGPPRDGGGGAEAAPWVWPFGDMGRGRDLGSQGGSLGDDAGRGGDADGSGGGGSGGAVVPPRDAGPVDPPTRPPARVALVTFGCRPEETHFGLPGWDTLLRHPTLTAYVQHDADPAHCGLAEADGAPAFQSFMGVTGSPPLQLELGDQIVATVYHRRGGDFHHLRARISFADPDSPAGATTDAPWSTMYVEAEAGHPKVGELGTLVFNISSQATRVCPAALPTEGSRSVVNFSFDNPDAAPGDYVLTRLELTDAADRTPPHPPGNLTARPLSLSPEAGETAIELTWDRPRDPPGPTGGQTGVTRYYVYRDGSLHDAVSLEWTSFLGEHGRYVDLGARAGVTHHYEVTVLDRATTGFYPTLGNLDTQRYGNESARASVDATLPDAPGCPVLDPALLAYEGAFALPDGEDWTYGGQGFTFFPGGNPQPRGGELPGSLYLSTHDRALLLAEVAIPAPVADRNLDALPRARILRGPTDVWPRVYNGHWLPDGDVEARLGLAYHPGEGGVGEGLYYGLYQSYSGDRSAAVHGRVSLDLAHVDGPWHIGALPGSPGHVSFLFTAKFLTRIPPAFAAAHTGGRSLMVGLGWPISGHGWPSAGPALGAIAPWESGALPPAFGTLSHQPLLRYGSTDEMDRWFEGWTDSHFFHDAEWVTAGSREAVVVAAARPRGDEWYGGENGYDNTFCDADVPSTIGDAMLRGPNDSDNAAVLYFYNPADLARVADGIWEAHRPQPYALLDVEGRLFTTEARFPMLRSLAYDPASGRLYGLESNARRGSLAVHVWRVGVGVCP